MTTTLTSGPTVISPELVTAYESARTARTVVHDIIGRSEPDVSLVPSGSRAGRLELLLTSEEAAASAEAALSTPSVWLLSSTDRPTINMSFVVADGSVERILDPTQNLWLVRFPYLAVTT